MRRSKAEIYLHFVWGTWGRLPLVTDEIERDVYRCIQSEAQRLKCVVLAVGGMPDHVHLIMRVPTTVSAAMLAQQIKGVSSTFVRDQLRTGELFRWQEGYGVFSLSRKHLKSAVAYGANQKLRHAESKIWSVWEETEENIDQSPQD